MLPNYTPARCRVRMFLSNRQHSFFPLAAIGTPRTLSGDRAEGEVSLAVAFSAQLLQWPVKRKMTAHRQRWNETHKCAHPDCKRCAEKAAGARRGEGLQIDAHMGAHLPPCGGRINNHNAGEPSQEAGAGRARSTTCTERDGRFNIHQ
jgi:hypothetical protein